MDAENILQEGFLKLFNNLHRFKGDMPIDGWMQKIFINTAMEHIRRKTLETTTETHQAKPFLVSRQPVWIDFMKKIF
jgi:RNA polymerase sigma-70 factor (ECF subfamily)